VQRKSLFLLLFLIAWPALVEARGKRSIFVMDRVVFAEGVPDSLEPVVRKQVATLVAKRTELLTEIPEDAPDPNQDAKAFERYLKKKNLRAFRVWVEISRYKSQKESKDGKNSLWVDVGLRFFGETIPGKSFGFSGDGAASIKIEVGAEFRPRDSEIAQSEAVTAALDQAISGALSSLKKKK
jgi:hypothetical protein